MKRTFLKSKFSRFVAAATVLVVGFGAAASATPAGTVDYVDVNGVAGVNLLAQGRDLQAPLTGQAVLFGAKLSAPTAKTVSQLFFACRTSTNANCDFGHQTDVTIPTTGLTFERPVTFSAADTYTVWVSFNDGAFQNFTPTMSVPVAPANPPVLLSRNKPATGSTACSTNEQPPKAVDGTFAGSVFNKFCSNATTKFLQVDLTGPATLDNIKVYHAGIQEQVGYNTRDFTLQVSGDATNWTTVATVVGNVSNITTHSLLGQGLPVERYVRFNCSNCATVSNSNGDKPTRIYELEVYGNLVPDTTAPSVPTGVVATATSSTSVTVNWTASTDNVAVTGYEVLRDGVLAGSPTGTSLVDGGRTANTTYSYEVRAKDAANNFSAYSAPPATATTPSPPAGPIANCFGDTKNSSGPIDQARLGGPGCGYPTLATTGPPAGTQFTQSSGVLNITTNNTIIENREHTGCIYTSAANVIIRNSIIHMTDGCAHGIGSFIGGADVPASGPLRINDVEVSCTTAHGVGALAGDNFIATRTRLLDCENGAEINENSQIIDSYIKASEVGNPSAHGDGLQANTGSNIVVRHNTFAGLNPITSSIITNPTNNHNWIVEDNFFSAGAYTLYCPESGTNFTVRNNRFYAPVGNYQSDPHRPAFGFTDACGHSGIIRSGNYRDDTLAPINF